MATATDTQQTLEPPAASSTSENPTWTVEQLEASLAHLERMQEAIDSLRSTIPDLVKPLRSRNSMHTDRSASRKDALYSGVKKAAAEKGAALKDFDEDWRGGETQRIFERAWESERVDGDLSKAMEVERWGWSRAEGAPKV